MEERFNKIKNIRFEIKDTFAKLTAKKDTVRGYYIQYIEKNKKNKMFGLDSFHFQSKLIDLEYKHLNEHYIFIDNRIYCDYYKLYNILIAFYKQNFKTDFKHRNYPIYKDLEPFKQYDFDDINNIHYDIIEMIQHAYALISQNNEEIKLDKQKLRSGFNIDNYIHNNIYKNTLLSTNVNLFENYLHSYHIYHMNFLKSLLDKLGLFQTQLSNNVRTDGVSPIVSEPSTPTTPSARSLDRVISMDDEHDINIVIDRSISRPDDLNEPVVIDVRIDNSINRNVNEIININHEITQTIEMNAIDSMKQVVDPIEEVKEEILLEDKEEVKEKVNEEVKEEFVENVIEEVKEEVIENVAAEVKEEVIENVVEEVKEEVIENVVEEVKEEVKEPVIENVVEEVKEEVIENVVENVVEEVNEQVVEEVNEQVVEEVKEKAVEHVVEEVKQCIIQNNIRGVEPNDVKPIQTNKKKNKKRR